MHTNDVGKPATGSALHPLHDVYDGIFNTAHGKSISINNPHPESITLEEIAEVLSKLCRFGGHVRHFYSVGQHSLLVAELAPYHLQKEALLHDATEAYLGDVIKPLKVMLRGYEVVEAIFMDVIIEKFQLSRENLLAIKVYDRLACEIEHLWLQQGVRHPDYKGTALFTPATPNAVEKAFLSEINKYYK